MKKIIFYTSTILLLAGCSSQKVNDTSQKSQSQISSEKVSQTSSSSTVTNDTESTIDDSTVSSSIETTPIFSDFNFSDVPKDYTAGAESSGTLQSFSYDTDGASKEAIVYLPANYDTTGATSYNIFYLMHGRGGNQTTYMGSPSNPTNLKNVIDHMIENEELEPTIFVMPNLSASGSMDNYRNVANNFFEELTNDLMPAVESSFSTFAEGTTTEDFSNSRWHRGFGGFSMGSVTTWSVMSNALSDFAYFLPMSGDSWAIESMGGSSSSAETAGYLHDQVINQGFVANDFYIFSATGTEDSAYENLPSQIEAMSKYPDTFDYTDVGFNNGNLTFYSVGGNLHDYPYTYPYLYNGLQQFFK